jgi:hypothetical protein
LPLTKLEKATGYKLTIPRAMRLKHNSVDVYIIRLEPDVTWTTGADWGVDVEDEEPEEGAEFTEGEAELAG